MSPLEIIAFVISVLAVWLTVRQVLWCWPIGLVGVLLYAWVFLDAKLYSDMLLQLIYAILQLYGWWQWARGGQDHSGRQVSRLTPRLWLISLTSGALGFALLGHGMSSYTDAILPWQDALLTAFSLVAQWWMAQKRVECWALWCVLDIAYVALFLSRELYLTAALYVIFVLLATRGWVLWQRELKGRLA